ncbi:MAG: aminotransferase class I/II-fold pyridoxal phosphate-dependent enzyme [Alphaproteobacteria bacterium]|nr:aminotransferase class I/II-fold pyridoxal phosphate-dependent enzyme [Alphaproteobacteria bacterium]
MLNDAVAELSDYPFPRLAALLKDVAPAPGLAPIDLSMGEPKEGLPAFTRPLIDAAFAEFGRYPPVAGPPELRHAIARWLTRRYRLAAGTIDPDRHVAPLAGTREGLFMLPLAVVPRARNGAKPLVLMPNPFYQVYKGGAVTAGAELVYLPATAATGFLPDLAAIPPAVLARTALFYLCSPSNPQGAVADAAYLRAAIALARTYDFTLAVDECYAEIYDEAPPPGGLEVAAATGSLGNIVVFHSLSKRSSAPGLRSGFIAGDPEVLRVLKNLRNYSAAGTPIPICAAATALWSEETHVEANRDRYRAKFAAAARVIGNRFGFRRPAGGFFLWLEVDDGESVARTLWGKAAVKVLPGTYLGHAPTGDDNPGDGYIRLALVHDADTVGEAMRRIAATL